MSEKSVVSIVRTTPKTVLSDYGRLMDLIDYTSILDPKKTTIKRVAAPASTVFLPGNKTSRNIIFAGIVTFLLPIKILLLINMIKRFFFPDIILLFCYASSYR